MDGWTVTDLLMGEEDVDTKLIREVDLAGQPRGCLFATRPGSLV